jgi:hypothetical protein
MIHPVSNRRFTSIAHPGWVLQRLGLVMAASAGLVAAVAHGAVATATHHLGGGGSGTFFAGNAFTSWIAKGTLPVGSILRSVSVNAMLESTNNANWANDLMVMLDPTPLAPGGDCLLAIGNGDLMGPTLNLTWANGFGGAGTPLSDTKAAPAHFPSTLDLHDVELLVGNSFDGSGVGGTWSGTVTVTYDTLDLATLTSFSLPENPAVINETSIFLMVPYGTNVQALAPTYTLTSGTCAKASGSTQDFSTPQIYSVTDGTITKVYTVTVAVQPTVTLGLSGSPVAEAGGMATVTATLSATFPRDVTVNLTFAGTATPVFDYTRSATSMVIPAGSTNAAITLTAVPDMLYESPDQMIVVSIGSVVNAALLTPQQVTAVIVDADLEARFPLTAGQRGIVACRDIPAVSYDIYLPTGYSVDAKPLPILYTFNPSGGGMVPEFMNVCANLQIIVVGIINSKNGGTWDVIQQEIYAVARDIRQRVLYDPTAEMASGFSGGGVVSYEFSRIRGQHVAGVFPMGGWMGVQNYAYNTTDQVRSGVRVARAAGTNDSGANFYLSGDKFYLENTCGAIVQDWSFPGGHGVAPDAIKTAALNWILANRTQAGANDRATALAQAITWRAQIGAGERQTVLRQAVDALMNQSRSWQGYQAQLILDRLMGDFSFRALDVEDLGQGSFARNLFYFTARGAALNNDWQTYRAGMKALAGITGADGYRSSDIFTLVEQYGYPTPILRISHADGQLGLSLSKDTPGLIYTLQTSPDLSGSNWQDVWPTTVETNTHWSSGYPVTPGETRRFFRILATPAASAVP